MEPGKIKYEIFLFLTGFNIHIADICRRLKTGLGFLKQYPNEIINFGSLWYRKFMDLSCFIKGQAVCNFSFRRVEGRAYVSLRPGQRIYLYPGLEFGYVNGLFGSLSSTESTKTTAFSYRHGFPLIELNTQSYSK